MKKMVNLGCLTFYILTCILIIHNITQLSCATDEDRQVYIVYMGSLPQGEYSPSSHHVSLLQQTIDSSSIANPLVRSYRRSFNGFSAKLTSKEAEKLARNKEVISVFPSKTYQLQTTRSWDFIGLNETVSKGSGAHSDVVIGVLDTGIWPESESFNDEGFNSLPKHWKGTCAGGKNFTCNNKIIGARAYRTTARDYQGHGSHTASTAAGNIVKDVSFFGLANGTARGGAPSAKIAAYAVCELGGCRSDDILAAFDDAIADGVDVITISIGSASVPDFSVDPIAIGAFHSAVKGILTFQSAGNNGPDGGTVASVAPWMVSVAASSIDRQFVDKLVLANGTTMLGVSVNSFTLNGTKYPLVYGQNASSSSCDEHSSSLCLAGCLNSSLVKGKIVLCDEPQGLDEALRAGAVGAISKIDERDVASVVPLPALGLTSENYDALKSYVTSTRNPQAEILRSETPTDSAAPVVASFSSRGPNIIAPDILKPDVSAPGVDIIAAFTPVLSPSRTIDDKRRVKYSVLSGTSMACPHAAGLGAHVKASHQNWSPSAIQSAIITTALPMSATKNPEAEFAYGAGQINPVKAVDPGLVYEALKADYINFLCSIGYDTRRVRSISGDNSSCPGGTDKFSSRDLNYPTLTASVSPSESLNVTFHRTVTNVGDATSTYKSSVQANSNLKIKVVPEVLSFKNLYEKKSFTVTVTGTLTATTSLVSSSLVWSDGKRSVRSPIVVYTKWV